MALVETYLKKASYQILNWGTRFTTEDFHDMSPLQGELEKITAAQTRQNRTQSSKGSEPAITTTLCRFSGGRSLQKLTNNFLLVLGSSKSHDKMLPPPQKKRTEHSPP